MRLSVIPSLAMHIAAVVGFLPFVANAWKTEATPMIILPVELVDIDELTNITPVTEKAKEAEKPEETKTEPTPAPAAPAPAPEPAEEILPSETPLPPKKEPEKKKEEPKPKEDFQSALKGILSSVEKDKPKEQRTATNERAANISNVQDQAPRKGAGDMKRMTASMAAIIASQLVSKGCWTDQSDMADARRLRTVIAVKFGRDGHFSAEPRLVEPAREVSGDPPLQVYIQRARTALTKCNQMGFQIPEQYFEYQPVQSIEIEFLPGMGAR